MTRSGNVAESPNWLSVFLVSAYLCGVGLYLILTRRIPSPGFRRIALATLRRPYEGAVTSFSHEQGNCFLARVPANLLSDRESSSSLRVFEDDRELGPGHASHEEIRRSGAGRFSHWGEQLYFSASDNSDPRSNGRRYRVAEVRR
jgi:hypothetical protein